MDFKMTLKRINTLYNKSKEEGLTKEEKAEQTELRKYYIDVIRGNIQCNLDKVERTNDEAKKDIYMKFAGPKYIPSIEKDIC